MWWIYVARLGSYIVCPAKFEAVFALEVRKEAADAASIVVV